MAVVARPLITHHASLITRSRSPLGLGLERLGRDRFAVGGGVVVGIMVLLALAAPLIAPNDPYAIDPTRRLAPVGTPGYPLGGDELGRCLLSRLLYGAQVSLLVAFVPAVVSMLLGVGLGAVAGFAGGTLDEVLMRLLDVVLAFPGILLALGIAASLGAGVQNIIISLTVVGIPIFGRLTRGAVLSIRERAFVEAARALGAGNARVLLSHVLPNVLAPIIVYFTLQCGRTVIASTGLSFLGLGAPAPVADWGGMLAAGQQVLPIAPHVATIAGVAIFVLTVGLNLLGDGLNDAFDPAQKE